MTSDEKREMKTKMEMKRKRGRRYS